MCKVVLQSVEMLNFPKSFLSVHVTHLASASLFNNIITTKCSWLSWRSCVSISALFHITDTFKLLHVRRIDCVFSFSGSETELMTEFLSWCLCSPFHVSEHFSFIWTSQSYPVSLPISGFSPVKEGPCTDIQKCAYNQNTVTVAFHSSPQDIY